MNDFLRRTWAEISLDALAQNYHMIRRCAGSRCKIMVMVKGDAYGHGAVPVSRCLDELGADYFGVAELDEAMQLRSGGIAKPILIMGYTPPDRTGDLIHGRIAQTVTDPASARVFSNHALRAGGRLTVHMKLDTGMGRLGIVASGRAQEAAREAAGICALPGLQVEGLFTHFATADCGNDEYMRFQLDNFIKVVQILDEYGVKIPIKHCANSASVLKYTQTHFDMVRPGIILYGLSPYGDSPVPEGLAPVMALCSTVSQLKELDEGSLVSYGGTYRTVRKTRMAVVPIGYADGLFRALSNRAVMLVRGKPAPLIGRICMDLCMLDVTDIADVREGDTVTVFGRDGESSVSAESLAALSGTISYEVATSVGKRIPRVYYKNDNHVETLNYIK